MLGNGQDFFCRSQWLWRLSRQPGPPMSTLWRGLMRTARAPAVPRGTTAGAPHATVSADSFVLSAPHGNFTSADLGKRGVALDWHGGNSTSGCWSGYSCFKGLSCQFTVSAVNTSTSITVKPVAGCGSSGVGFDASGDAYWSVYSDDSIPLSHGVERSERRVPERA
jgi:hypothetical protein